MACASACDTCRQPGHCCVGFHLNLSGLDDMPMEEAAARVAQLTSPAEDGRMVPTPFLPLWHDPAGRWRWWCPVLQRDGRCGDYANRPEPCHLYQPGTDRLCAEYVPPPTTPDPEPSE